MYIHYIKCVYSALNYMYIYMYIYTLLWNNKGKLGGFSSSTLVPHHPKSNRPLWASSPPPTTEPPQPLYRDHSDPCVDQSKCMPGP